MVLSFPSLQTAAKGPDGDVCDLWTLNYTTIRGAGGSWLIDDAGSYHGTMHTSCS